ncbi:hypothetical protein JCM10212_004786 [Sporobolomyces blumeae]
MSQRAPSPWGQRSAVRQPYYAPSSPGSSSSTATSASPPSVVPLHRTLPPARLPRIDSDSASPVDDIDGDGNGNGNDGDSEDGDESDDGSSVRDLTVHSTSPPSKPCLPPSPRTAQPISPSILLNPLPNPSASSASSNGPASAILKRLPGKRRQSVVVEVHHSPPPAHFYQDPEYRAFADDDPDDSDSPAVSPIDVLSASEGDAARVGRSLTTSTSPPPPPARGSFTNMSPPRPDLSGMRSRSASPIHTPRSTSPARPPSSSTSAVPIPGAASSPSQGPLAVPASTSSNGTSTDFVPLTSIISSRSSATNASTSSQRTSSSTSPGIRFAPLPPGRRAHRSNSLSIGVASRARMIGAQGGTPNVQQARYAGPLQWYEGGEMPGDVYTWRDAQKGLSKIWKKVSNGKDKDKGALASSSPSSSVASSSTSPPPLTSLVTASASSNGSAMASGSKMRSASLSSTTSGGSVEEARRMEREAKTGGKGEVEHVEEAIVEEVEDEDDEDGDDEDEEAPREEGEDVDTESEVTAPRTPPEGQALGLSHVGADDLEKAQRRLSKGKGKEVVHEEHVAGLAV